MAASNRILGEQDVAWVQQEVLPVTGLEVQCTAQRDDELPNRGGVPIKRAAGCRLLKRNGRRGEFSGQERHADRFRVRAIPPRNMSSGLRRSTGARIESSICLLTPSAGCSWPACRVRVRLTAHKATA